MKVLTATAALATFTLAGCAQIWPLPIGGSQPIREEVSFEGGKIKPKSVAIVVPAGRSSATLEWQLPKGDASFTADGIVIEGAVVFPSETELDVKTRQRVTENLRVDRQQKSNFACTRSEDRLKFTCTSEKLTPGIYKYTIRVQRGSEVYKVDPPVVIMGAAN